MQSILYFAYGSNMLTRRLQARCASARVIGAARLPYYRLSFAKRSADGSGKATILVGHAPAAMVEGVVFNIAASDMRELDKFEGLGVGYDRLENISVFSHGADERLAVTTYIACEDALDHSLQPYHWYLNLVIAGAEEHQLAADYIQRLREQRSLDDPFPDRKSRQHALELLRAG